MPIESVRLGALVVALFALSLVVTSAAQDPVVKPGTTTTLDRLPVPASVTARQLADGRIELRWNAVEGAARYEVWRSVPPGPQTVVMRPNPSDTTYIDSDIKVGSTYYYVVAAVTANGAIGLKAGSLPVKATIAVAPSLRPNEPGTVDIGTGLASPTTMSGSGVVPAVCAQTGVYKKCISNTIQYSPLAELVKTATVLCPDKGQVVTGGGFAGNLVNMSVVASMPLLSDTEVGWTVIVVPTMVPGQDPVMLLSQLVGVITRSFQVFAICAPAGTAP